MPGVQYEDDDLRLVGLMRSGVVRQAREKQDGQQGPNVTSR